MKAFLLNTDGSLTMFDEDEGVPKSFKKVFGDIRIYYSTLVDDETWDKLLTEATRMVFDYTGH